MSEFKKMVAGKLYKASKVEPEYKPDKNRALNQKINQLNLLDIEKIVALEKELFGQTGDEIFVNPPLYIDYGKNTRIGQRFYANMDCIFLDVAPITIGDDVMFGPRVSLITASHPIDAGVRQR
ncbi:MAG: sugar O-acetyltransferase, partial [Lactococcus lactis]|nr:sugar O-acetyltransferase [Lactococcus lactis]